MHFDLTNSKITVSEARLEFNSILGITVTHSNYINFVIFANNVICILSLLLVFRIFDCIFFHFFYIDFIFYVLFCFIHPFSYLAAMQCVELTLVREGNAKLSR